MTAPAPVKKNEALIRGRKELAHCAECGLPYDAVEANSHQATDDPNTRRIYFQFLHGSKECISFTMAVDFETWLTAALEKSPS